MPKSLRNKVKHLCYNGTLTEKERDRILKALEQQSSEDCISREEALLALTGMDLPTDRDKLIALFTERIQNLPPVTPQRPKGKWITWKEAGNYIPSETRFECSVCHDVAQTLCNGLDLLSPYCPNCGAEMEVEHE